MNARNGAGENQCGVKPGDIRALAKKIKGNPDLVKELWNIGNVDAMLLATLAMRPKQMSLEELAGMLKSLRFTQLAYRLCPPRKGGGWGEMDEVRRSDDAAFWLEPSSQ